MERPSGPFVNELELAQEVKAHIYANMRDHVDYKARVVQMWPSPTSDETPEIKKFCSQFSEAFKYADSVTGEDGQNFPEDLIGEYEEAISRVERAVNSDLSFWIKVRSEVLPFYDRLRDNPNATPEEKALHEEWTNERWRSIRLFYDPVGMEVKTTKRMRGKESGHIYNEEVVTHRIIPEGLVIDLDGVGLSTIQKR